VGEIISVDSHRRWFPYHDVADESRSCTKTKTLEVRRAQKR
jgi:hypothetical protein